jgi:hypothetical protein
LHGAYCVVRYVPNPEQGEAIDIGLVLISSGKGRVKFKFSNLIDFSTYPAHLKPPKELIESAKSYVRDLRKRAKNVDPIALLSGIHRDLLNNIQISEPYSCEFDDLNSFFYSLYGKVIRLPSGHAHRLGT